MPAVRFVGPRGAVWTAQIADGFWSRMRGLLGATPLAQDRGLWLVPCNSVHTFFLAFPIDIVYLSHQHTVVKLQSTLPPFRVSFGGRRAASAIELASGSIDRMGLQVGDQLVRSPD